MIRIGCVNIDTSHPLAFSDVLASPPFAGKAVYAAVYNDGFRGDDEVAGFMKKNAIASRASSLEAMADGVDVAFIHSVNWDRHVEQARPFVEKNIPVFIDKPIAGNLKDCRQLETWAAEGKVILGSSSLRYCVEVEDFLRLPEKERGEILSVYGTCGVDEFNYGIHVVELISGLVGPGLDLVRFLGGVSKAGKTVETFQMSWANGMTCFYSTYQGAWQPNVVTVQTTVATHYFKVDTTKIYAALIGRILQALEQKRPMAGVADLTESVKAMIAGKVSREKSGAGIRLRDLDEKNPGYDGTAFAKEYARQAKKMYV